MHSAIFGPGSSVPAMFLHYDSDPSPEETYRHRRGVGLFLHLVLAANAAMFIVCLYYNNWQIDELSNNPLVGFDASILEQFGATSYSDIHFDNEWWRIVSSLFVSAGAVQMMSNSSLMYCMGGFLANKVKFVPIVVTFFLSGAGAVMFSAAMSNQVVTSASSAPAFALVGGAVMELLLHHKLYRHFFTWLLLLCSTAVAAAIGATPFVDNWANIYAFFVGALLISSVLLLQSQDRDSGAGEFCLMLAALVPAALAVGLLALAVFMVVSSRDFTAECGTPCQTVTCVPSPFWNCQAAVVRPGSCGLQFQPNGTASLQCPSGGVQEIPATNATIGALDALCTQYCPVL